MLSLAHLSMSLSQGEYSNHAINISNNIRLTLGSSIQITYTAKVYDFIGYNAVVPNAASMVYNSSLSSYSRLYNPVTASSSVTTPLPSMTSSFAGDVHGSTPTLLSVGEIMSFITTIVLPPGQSTHLYTFTSFTVNGAVLQVLNTTLQYGSQVNITASTPIAILDSNNDTYNDKITYDMGRVLTAPSYSINPAASSVTANNIVMTVYLYVPNNTTLNVQGAMISMNHTLYVDNNPIIVIQKSWTIVEPGIVSTPTAIAPNGQSGSIYTITTTLTHNTSSKADALRLITTYNPYPSWSIIPGTVSVQGGGNVNIITGNNAGDSTLSIYMVSYSFKST